MTSSKPPASIRLHGVVRARRTAEQRLAARLTASEARELQHWAAGIVAQVEQICAAHQVDPGGLNAPTRQAYLFLRDVSQGKYTQTAPGAQKKSPEPRRPAPTSNKKPAARNSAAAVHRDTAPSSELRLRGLQREVDLLHRRLSEAAKQNDPARGAALQSSVAEEIAGFAAHLKNQLERRGASPAALTPPSRRAYGWLLFLNQPANLAAHLAALRCVLQAAGDQKPPLEVVFYPQAYLYHTRQQGGVLHLTAHAALVGAPPELLRGMAEVARRGARSKWAAALRAYSSGAEYARLLAALEPGDHPAAGARGQVWDLEQVFRQVNQKYFAGELPMPNLRWSRRATHRKLGHYSPATDTVELSKTLDQPGIPQYMLDFVMYHELLHKSLGVQVVDGRRRAHTPAFRRAEKRFERYAEAAAWMKKGKLH